MSTFNQFEVLAFWIYLTDDATTVLEHAASLFPKHIIIFKIKYFGAREKNIK